MLKKQLLKLNITQEKGKDITTIFQTKQIEKDDRSFVYKSCFDIASSSHMDIVEDFS